MPKPKEGETRKEFVSRCIPIVKKEDKSRDIKQVTAICYSIWKKENKENKKMTKENKFSVVSRQLGPEKTLVIYLENDEGFLEGWSFKPIKSAQTLKLKLGDSVKKISKAPIRMLEFDGTIPTGKPGASRNYPGIYKILDKGTYSLLSYDSGNYIYEFDGDKLNGKFAVNRLEDREVIESTKYQYVFDKTNKLSLEDELLNQLDKLLVSDKTKQVLSNDDCNIKILSELSDGLTPLRISGVALVEGKWNGFFYPRDELKKAAHKLTGLKFMKDHRKDTDAVVGRVTKSWYDNEILGIRFEAEIIDEEMAKKIVEGLVESVSVGVYIDKFEEDGEPVARNYIFNELSAVIDPACEKAAITDFKIPE